MSAVLKCFGPYLTEDVKDFTGIKSEELGKSWPKKRNAFNKEFVHRLEQHFLCGHFESFLKVVTDTTEFLHYCFLAIVAMHKSNMVTHPRKIPVGGGLVSVRDLELTNASYADLNTEVYGVFQAYIDKILPVLVPDPDICKSHFSCSC